jgi:putative endonuclease
LTKRDGSPLTSREIGDFGERVACAWLRARSAKILYRNFRAPGGGEVDIVAREGRVLLFIEVKTRTSESFGRPLDAVGARKQKLIKRGANAWLKSLGTRELPWRFDVIEIHLRDGARPRVNRVENVFG